MRDTPPVIVGLTTFPARNGTLGPTLSSLAAQSRAPDEIRIYATPGCVRPPQLYGATWIGGVLDEGPLTKLSAARDLALSPDAILVTCDDDQIYDPRWLETLVLAAKAHPDCAVGMSGWNARGFFTDRDSYEWVRPPAPCDVLEGYAGVAYRRGWFDESLWDVSEGCRKVDDVWISGYLHARGIARRVTDPKMCRPAPSDKVGLHTRADFVGLNRNAARMLFGGDGSKMAHVPRPAPAPALRLSICIPSLADRLRSLDRLLACLHRQPRVDEVEILVAIDAGQVPTGTKRNRLITAARGDYVVFAEDDDLVSEDYIGAILQTIERSPGVDAVLLRGRRREPGGVDVTFDYGRSALEGDTETSDLVVWRPIGHLCPVRRELAARVPFPDIAVGDDLPWSDRMAPLVKTTARAGAPEQVLYHYEYAAQKPGILEPSAGQPSLTICIPSLAGRRETFARLLACLSRQPRARDLEILAIIDSERSQRTTGDKRNRLVAQASGAYVVHIDDDDLVSDEYARAICDAIDKHPEVDVIYVRGQQRVIPGGHTLLFDYGCAPGRDGAIEGGALWRRIGHLCPIRAEIAKATPFPDMTVGEDLRWAKAIAPKIKTSARAGRPDQVLYYYEFSPHKKDRVPAPEVAPPPAPALGRPMKRRRAVPGGHTQGPAVPGRAALPKGSAQINDHAQIFAPQYVNSSGPGSALSVTQPYRDFLARFIREQGVRSILDLGCGDLEIMSHVDIGQASYLGVDVIAERIVRDREKLAKHPRSAQYRFAQGDARSYPLSDHDLVICKDVLQHWTNAEVQAWLARWRFGFGRGKLALVTNCNYGPTVNRDAPAGSWRALDLTRPPFGLGQVVFSWDLPRGDAVDHKDVVLLTRGQS